MRGVVGFIGVVTLLAFLPACDSSDVGRHCGTDAVEVENPIDGETPVVEVVRIEHDDTCQTFNCLTHRGLPRYCTQSCRYQAAEKGAKSCTSDADCKLPNQCVDGVCRDDDCPSGFVCKAVQAVGPLAGKTFCVAREGCQKNADCEDLGRVECKKLGCFDSCCAKARTACLTQSPQCTFHSLECQSFESLGCSCAGLTGSELECADAELVCQPEATVDPWPAGAVARHNVCQLKNP